MIERKKVAVIAVAEYFTLLENQKVQLDRKVSWTESRVGWSNQPRNNWTKQK
jgi:hypothetical protein